MLRFLFTIVTAVNTSFILYLLVELKHLVRENNKDDEYRDDDREGE